MEFLDHLLTFLGLLELIISELPGLFDLEEDNLLVFLVKVLNDFVNCRIEDPKVFLNLRVDGADLLVHLVFCRVSEGHEALGKRLDIIDIDDAVVGKRLLRALKHELLELLRHDTQGTLQLVELFVEITAGFERMSCAEHGLNQIY